MLYRFPRRFNQYQQQAYRLPVTPNLYRYDMAKQKYICPKCGKRTGADILYGDPAWERVKDDVKAGYLVIGGCCVHPDNPDRECTKCGRQWRIKRRKPEYPNELDPVPTLFVFEIGGFTRPGYRIEWRDGALFYSKGPSTYSGTTTQKSLSREDWLRFWSKLQADGISLWNWKSRYENPEVMDGTQWELILVQDQYTKRIYGSNAFPDFNEPDWTRSREFCGLILAIGSLVGNKDFMNDLP
ncbi:MAG: hypothetical protein P8171_25840 [Candidatus Thiodiazotropha sp.]